MSKGRTIITLLVLASFLLAACQKGQPASRQPAGRATKQPAAESKQAAEAKPGVAGTPSIPVAAASVQLVQGGKVAPAQPAVHVFLWGHPETTDRDLKLAKDAGFQWVKQRFEWRNIEKTKKGAYEWYEAERIVDAVNKAGLAMVVRLDNQPEWARRDKLFPKNGPPDKMDDWKDFVEALSEHFKGKIAAYEIWNEPNLSREWGDAKPDPKAYSELLKTANTSIKKKDPNALVISAGMSPTTEVSDRAIPSTQFVDGMYAAGAKQSFDMLGDNAPGFKAEPEADPAVVAQDPALTNNDPSPVDLKRAYAFRHAEDIRALMTRNGDDAKQMAIMEMGWTADPRPTSPYAWHSVTEDKKGEYLVRALQYAKTNWSPWIGLMTVIYLPSPTWTASDEQYYWSIANPDGSPRPAYGLLRGMPH